jgi:hypothetical protein
MAFRIQQGTNENRRRRVFLHLVDAIDGITAKTGQTGTAVVIDSNLNVKATTNSIVEVSSSNAPGLYYVELTTAEVQNLGPMQIRFKNAFTAEFQDLGEVVLYDPYDNKNTFNPWQQVAGPDIDYKRIDRMIAAQLEKLPRPAEQKEVDLAPISQALQALFNEIRAIDLPKPIPTDLGPVMSKIDALEGSVKQAIGEIRIPEQLPFPEIPETDFTPVVEPINGLVAALKERNETDVHLKQIAEKMEDALDMHKLRSALDIAIKPKEPEEKAPILKKPKLV